MNLADGTEKWTVATGDAVEASPYAVGDTVYVTSKTGQRSQEETKRMEAKPVRQPEEDGRQKPIRQPRRRVPSFRSFSASLANKDPRQTAE